MGRISVHVRRYLGRDRRGGPKTHSPQRRASEAAKGDIDLARVVSGRAVKSNELKRLYRDVRCGSSHPENALLVPEIVGKRVLGIGLDGPRVKG